LSYYFNNTIFYVIYPLLFENKHNLKLIKDYKHEY